MSRLPSHYYKNIENAKIVGALLLEGLTREETAERLGFSMWRVGILERKFWRERPTYSEGFQHQASESPEQVFV